MEADALAGADRPAARGLGTSTAFSVLAGLAAAVPIGRASGRARRRASGVAAVAAGTAAAVLTARAAAAQRRAAADGVAAPPTARQLVGPGVVGAVVGGAAAGGVVLSVAMDRRMESTLVRRGVRRPRLVLGTVSGLATFAMDRLDSRVATSTSQP